MIFMVKLNYFCASLSSLIAF